MNAVSIAEFRKNMAVYLDQARFKRKPIFLGKRNNPDFVILPYGDLDAEDIEMYSSKNFRKKLEEAREEVRQGKYYTLEEAEKRLHIRKQKSNKQ